MDLPLCLEHKIAVGLQQLARGEATTYDDQSLKERFEQIKAEGRKSLTVPALSSEEDTPA
jgi:hypothetical protein